MSKEYNFYIYIMASFKGVIYIGVTNNIARRVYQHKNNLVDGFTKKYNCHNLVYVENYNDIRDAIKREKQLKKYNRQKKINLIEKQNPEWVDLYDAYL